MNVAIGVILGLLITAVAAAAVALIAKRSYVVKRLSLALYVGGFAAGLKVFTLTAPQFLSSGQLDTLEAVLYWVVMLLAALAILQTAGLYFFDVYLHAQRGVRLPPLLPMVTKGLAYLLAVLITFQISFPEIDFSALVATSAITSLVLGLALQPILGNFFAGLVISLEKPFRINDWIELDGTDGLVTDITWRTTHLRTRDNDSLVIPNSSIAGQQITNFFYPHPLHLERVHVGVHYRTPPYRVREALQQAARVTGVLDKPTPEVHLISFDDSAITYELRLWIEDHAGKPRIISDVKEAIWENFRLRGIVIPFPIRTLELAPQEQPLRVVTPETGKAPRALPRAQLFVTQGPDQGAHLTLEELPVTVGRSRSCQLVLTERQSSKEHFQVVFQENAFVLKDLGSQFGTRVNGVSVNEQALRDLDRISIGATKIVFEC